MAFPAIWWAVVSLLSQLSGWRRLGREYAAQTQPQGQAFRWQTGKVGMVPYRNSLDVTVAPDGIFISVWLLLRFAHKTLYIPWKEIGVPIESRVLGRSVARFQVGREPKVTIELPAMVFSGRSEGAVARGKS
jgi:hypothetical protein